ncbi:MAG: hypothetical protein RL595_888 [Planctomycetota bacterium]
MMRLWTGLVLLSVCFPPCILAQGQSAQVMLAIDGKAILPIVHGSKAGAEVKGMVARLAAMMGKITGANFETRIGDGREGIAIGTPEDFPALASMVDFQPSDPLRREEYLLKTHAKGVWLLGATPLACQHAMWDMFYRIGYRQYFPGASWEVVPFVKNLTLDFNSLEKPSYHSRRIWYGFGAWDYAKQPYLDWCEKNRGLQGVNLSTGHAYDGIVKALKKEFDAHPEYWPLLNNERKPVRNPKPELGNSELRKKIVEHALSQVQKNPLLDSISMDPSDGGGWSESRESAALGSVTDQALTLANEVAGALNSKYPGKLVGIYAYNYHSAPPSIRVHPRVIVSVATAFIKGGQSLDEILAGWAAKGATLGIREYYSVNTWDRDQPGHARGGNLDYLQRTIPDFYSKGARFMSAESSDNWGPNGLGYYFASRVLWNVAEAKNRSVLEKDFLDRCFGPASHAMKEFYDQLDGSKPHLVVDDQLGRMFRAVDKARKLTSDVSIHKRLEDLLLYCRYASLYHQYATSDGNKRQAAFENLIRHAYRMRTTMMVHTYALYRDLPSRDKTVTVPSECKWQIPEGTNPWKSSKPFSADELTNFMADGLSRHKVVELNFKQAVYGSELLPASSALKIPSNIPEGDFGSGRGNQTFLTHVEKANSTLELQITGGLIAHYRDRGNVKVEVFKIGGSSQTGDRETLVYSDSSVPPDGKERKIAISLRESGLYKILVRDGQDKTQVKWPQNQIMTVQSTQDEPMNRFYAMWMGYFYVPKGTKIIGFFGGEHGEVRDSQDRPHFWLNGREANFYTVAVPPGEDGKFWRVRYMRGAMRLLTVPPYFARSPNELLLPKEVLEADKAR